MAGDTDAVAVHPGRAQFGAYLRLKMQEFGWSKDRTARIAGVEPSLITYYLREENKDAVPKLDTIRAFARAFGVKTGVLLQVCGIDPDSLGGVSDSTAALLEAMPELRAIVDDVASLPPDAKIAALAYISDLRRRYRSSA